MINTKFIMVLILESKEGENGIQDGYVRDASCIYVHLKQKANAAEC